MRLATPLLMVALATAALAQEAPWSLVATADNAGAVLPCQSCGSDGLGGLARRATLLAQLAGAGELLRIDAGNAFFGAAETDPVLVRTAYEAIGYQAVNLSWRDFRRGRDGLEQLIADAGLPFVAANLASEQGDPFAPAFVVATLNGRRIAVLGLTEAPAGLAVLPHLRRQLQGVRIADPAQALLEQLPRASAAADAVVLAWYGAFATLEPLLAQHGAQLAAVAVGGVDPASLPATCHGVPLVAALDRGREVAELRLGAAAPQSIRHPVAQQLAQDPIVAGILAAALAPAATTSEAKAPAAAPALPAVLELDSAAAMAVEGHNRSLRLQVTAASLRREVDAIAAPPGRAWLIVDTEWVNCMPGDLAYGLGYGEGGQVQDLNRHLFARIDGDVAARMVGGNDAPARLPASFGLADIGDRRVGRAVFAVPAATLRDVSLHFYSQRFGPIAVQLVGGPSTAAALLQPEQSMPLFSLGVHGFTLADSVAGEEPPPGSRFAIVDLRGRSRLQQPTDARALRADAALDAKVALPLIAEYPKADVTLSLLVDGEFARAPEWQLGSMAREPVFFPDRAVGGQLVFRVPTDATSLELVCAFGELGLSTGGGPGKVAALRFPLAGRRAQPANIRPLARVQDDVAVDVLSVTTVERFAGSAPAASQQFAVVRLRLRNGSAEDGVFEPYRRFTLAGAAPDAVTLLGPHAPPEQLFLPAGERRGFELVFAVTQGVPRLPLACNTVKHGMQFVDLDLEPPAVGHAAPAPAQAVTTGTAAPPAAAPPAAAPSPTPRGLAGVGLHAAEVNAAIDRGRAFLWAQVQRDLDGDLSRFPASGEHVLAALALVHTGAHREFPACDALLRRYLLAGRFGRGQTYQLGVFAMTVDAFGDPACFPWLPAIAQRLIDGQQQDGSWGYSVPAVPDLGAPAPTLGGDDLLQILSGDEACALAAPPEESLDRGSGDNSTSQFAMLGLRAAARHGVAVPAATWQRAVELYRGRQGAAGGWSYNTGREYGSMTCAGITGILLGRWGQDLAEPAADPGIARALGWLDQHFTATGNPLQPGHHDFYALYSLERVGRLLDTEFLGRHEWYPQGARVLVDRQRDDGSWLEKKDTVVPTAFALLFLTRATEKLVEEPAAGPATLVTELRLPPPCDYYFVIDASGSMLDRLDDRGKFDIARDVLRDSLDALAPDQQLALRAYGHRRTARDPQADQDTELLVPLRAADAGGRRAFLLALESLRPRGKTPLSLSLQQTARDLRGRRLEADRPVTVVLLTDGGEDTRETDPVTAAAKLTAIRGVRLEVIGFDIGQPRWSRQLRDMAAAARGRYWSAAGASDLDTVVRASIRCESEPVHILNANGREVAVGEWSARFELPAGAYTLRSTLAGAVHEQPLRLAAGRTTRAVYDVDRVRNLKASRSAATTPAGFCSACGQRLAPQDRFCPGCGQRIRE